MSERGAGDPTQVHQATKRNPSVQAERRVWGRPSTHPNGHQSREDLFVDGSRGRVNRLKPACRVQIDHEYDSAVGLNFQRDWAIDRERDIVQLDVHRPRYRIPIDHEARVDLGLDFSEDNSECRVRRCGDDLASAVSTVLVTGESE